ncbi:MAG TPA: hypothetical protein VII06_17780 [Chloroflexota bacterium]
MLSSRAPRPPAPRVARGGRLAAGLALLALVAASPARVGGAPAAALTPTTAGGDSAAVIRPAVDAFRAALGPDNGTGGTYPTGRREINWDNVPDGQAAPNTLPPNYFNTTVPRGATLATRGSGLQVSAADSGSVPVRFGNLHPSYTALFTTFSSPRLFTALGSTRFEVSFSVPGTTTPATVSAFGAVFANVADPNTSGIALYDGQGNLLGEVFAPPGALAFAAAQLDATGTRIARVQVTAGNTALAVPDRPSAVDVVAVDDLIYAEPQAQAAATPTVVTLVATPTPTPPPANLTVQQAIARVALSGQAGAPAAAQPGQRVTVSGAVSGTGTVTASMAWALTATVPAGTATGSVPVAVIATTQGLQGFACAAVPAGAPTVACNGATPGNALQGSIVTVVFPGGLLVTGTVSGPGALAALPPLPPLAPPPMPPPLLPPAPPFLLPVAPLPGAGLLAPGAAPEVPVIPEAEPLALVIGGLLAVGALARTRRASRSSV